MRIAAVILAASLAALSFSAPALAKGPGDQKNDDKSASSRCHAYEQAGDGSWKELPCQEMGAGGQTQHKPPAKGSEEAPR